MHLFYIDESGTPYSHSSINEFFVLSTIILHDKEWESINSKINAIKRYFFPNRDLSEIELKGSRIWNSKGEFELFGDQEIKKMFTELCSILDQSEIKIISIVVKKNPYIFNHPDHDMLNDVWKYMLERIEMYLTSDGNRDHGLIIMDSINPDEDKKRDKLMDSFKLFGTGQVQLNHILEITYTDSGLKNLIQLVDIVAFITRLHMREDTKDTIQKYWKVVEENLRRDFNGNYMGVGLKIIE